jgi:hypothetical protein
MKSSLILVLFLFFSFSCFANNWEYKVVYVPGTASGGKVTLDESGGYLDKIKTDVLNKLAKDGWELVSVTGASGADHALYLKRLVTESKTL